MKNLKINNQNMLIFIKSFHTIIWIFFNVVLFYMTYEVLANKIDLFFWIGTGLIIIEFLVLLFFKMICPMTILARKYSDSTRENFDIYLPNWLAKYNKQIYTIFFMFIICGLIFRTLNK